MADSPSAVQLVARRYDADRGSLSRAYPLAASPTRHARLKRFQAQWLAALKKLDTARWNQPALADLQKLHQKIERDQHELEQYTKELAGIAALVPFASTIIPLEEARRCMDRVDAARAAGLLNAMTKQIDQLRQAVQAGQKVDGTAGALVLSRDQASRAAEVLAGLRLALRNWFRFYDGYDPLFTWWLAEPYKEADQALGGYLTVLRDVAKNSKAEEGARLKPGALGAAGRLPAGGTDVPDLGELLAFPRSELAGVVRAYQSTRMRTSRISFLPRQPRPRSPEQLARLKGFYSGWLSGLRKLEFDRLSLDGRIDYQLLRHHLERELRRLELPAPAGSPGRKDASGITGRPIGRAALLSELAGEMIPYTPEELIAIAEREYAWCEVEMKKASKQMGFGDDWPRAVEKVKTLHVGPGEQPGLIRDLAREAIAYLHKHDLVTVPPLASETWRMEMMSPKRQLVNPFFTGGEVISVSFPTSGMAHEAKLQSMRGNNVHFARATVHHELIPGHHLQGYMTARFRSHRAVLGTPFWLEGWALYWEMVLYARGFPRTPEDRVGFLFWRMHRCARIIFSLSFHLGKMTPGECIELLVKKVGHERDNATAEVRRSFAGSYSPLYQAAYMLGGLQLRALRQELVDSGKMSERAFHDAVLRENRIPIALVRASLTRQKLAADWKSDWKFYGPISPKRSTQEKAPPAR
jgi:uncharacterized protein (DUF885 family)